MDEFIHIEKMAKELRLVKTVWDLMDSVENQLENWRNTLFSMLDIDILESNTKKLI